MSTHKHIIDDLVKEVVDIIEVSTKANRDGSISFFEKVGIAKEAADLIKYIDKLGNIVEEWKGMASPQRTDVFLAINAKLQDKGIYPERLEELVEGVINWAEATVQLIKISKAFKDAK